MNKIILTYGLISGLIGAALLTLSTLAIRHANDLSAGEAYGYAGMLLSMLLVYFGVRACRDQEQDGRISLGQALRAGGLIALISCVCYVVSWMLLSEALMPDFMEKYAQFTLEQFRASGASAEALQAKSAEMQYYQDMYKKPLFKAAVTFLEPLPVAALATLVSAFMLRKK